MNRCIKCGREIPEGELFCLECSLNPGSSLFEEQEKRPAPKGKMQTPQPVKREAPVAVAVKPERKKKQKNTGLKAALAVVTLLLVGLVAFNIAQYGSLKAQRTRLETKEADMMLRDKEREELQLEVDALTSQLSSLNNVIKDKETEIDDLKRQLSGSMSSQSQSQYDLTTTQAELERLESENEQLLLLEQELKDQIEERNDQITELETELEEAKDFEAKANFMDKHVVFVEDDHSGYYHTYSCGNFPKRSFWAYSRNLAEARSYEPCPVCGGKP